MTTLQVRVFLVDSLTPYFRNPRRGAVDEIAQSLKKRGQYRPIVVNLGLKTGRVNEILAGNHTWMAARKLGWASIQATTVDVDDEGAAAIVVADNRLADLGTYDSKSLEELLGSLSDTEGLGFSDADLEMLLGGERLSLTDPDEVPSADEVLTRCEPGMVVELGSSRLLCGDATDVELVKTAMQGGLADCVWTDPPYGVDYVGKTPEALTIQNDGASGLSALLSGAFKTLVACSRPGAAVYVAHADEARGVFETALSEAGVSVRQVLVWVKNTFVLGRADYHYRHEPILYGFTPAPAGSGRLGRGGARWLGDNKQSTVFEVAKPTRNSYHPTMKPVELVEHMLANSCPSGGLVLDLFAGSGSTLIAAHRLGMRAVVVELDAKYADVICARYQKHTGVIPRIDGREVDFLSTT